MCHAAVNLITNALGPVDNAESLLKVKNLVALFMQAMDVSYSSHRTRKRRTGTHYRADVELFRERVRQITLNSFRKICRFAQETI